MAGPVRRCDFKVGAGWIGLEAHSDEDRGRARGVAT